MTATKDVDLREQAEERVKESLMRKAVNAKMSGTANIAPPPELALKEYTATSSDPSSYPLSLTALSSKFGGSGNLLSLQGKTLGVPSSPPIAMSDYAGKGTNYRITGRINIDRYDCLFGGGLTPKPSYTWDRKDNTYFPESAAKDDPWRHNLVSSHEFVAWLQAFGRVTDIRSVNVKFRVTNTRSGVRSLQYIGLYTPAGLGTSLEEATWTYIAPSSSASILEGNVILASGGIAGTHIKPNGTAAAKLDVVRSHIENGFLSRLSFESGDSDRVQLTDFHVIVDFDVVTR